VMRLRTGCILAMLVSMTTLRAQRGDSCEASSFGGGDLSFISFHLPAGTVRVAFPATIVSGEKATSALRVAGIIIWTKLR